MRLLMTSAWAWSALATIPLTGLAAEPTPAPPPAPARVTSLPATSKTILALRQPVPITKATDWKLGTFLEELTKLAHVQFEIDTRLLAVLGMQDQDLRMVQMPQDFAATTSLGDALLKTVRSIAATTPDAQQTNLALGIRVRGNTIVLGPTFVPPTIPRPGTRTEEEIFISPSDILAAYYGPSVALTATQKPLRDLLEELRDSSGSSIVVDPKIHEKLDLPMTLTLTDARLMTALQVLGRLSDTSVALIDNVFYLTDEATADQLNFQWQQKVFGERAEIGRNPNDPFGLTAQPTTTDEETPKKTKKGKKGKKKPASAE